MMYTKCIFSLLFFFAISSSILFAQKAKFKDSKTTCQKIRLPQNYINPENRIYNIYAKGSYSGGVQVNQFGIFGWTLDEENPRMEAEIDLYGFETSSAELKTEDKVKKDEDGNVTDRWKEYSYSGSASGRGQLSIFGESNPFRSSEPASRKKSKAQLKQEAAAEAERKDLADNPFLSAEDIDAADKQEDLAEGDLAHVDLYSLNISESVSTTNYTSKEAALENFKKIERPKLQRFKDGYTEKAYRKAIGILNQQYGYTPVKYTVWLREMKSDKHPEFKMWNDACQAVETMLKSFKYNESIADKQVKFEPIINYYNDQVEQSSDSDRKARGIRRSAFHNLTQIMYYLDRQRELITMCDAQLESKHLGILAKRMLKKAMYQEALMRFHRTDTRHIEELNEEDESIFETEEEAPIETEGQ